jgi:putative membrane protein
MDRTRWAADRTLWAADRTFIAWLRTAISMIGFGISIGKAGDALQQNNMLSDKYYTLQTTGVLFITLAIIGLAGALVQNYRIQRRLSDQGFGRVEPVPLGMTMGILVLGFGVLGGIFIFL